LQEQVRNSFEIDGVLTEVGALRYSPAVCRCWQGASSTARRQMEAGLPRGGVELQVVALGDKAKCLPSPSSEQCPHHRLHRSKSLRSRAPVLHIDTIEFLEGTNHGIQASNEA
jgi:primosomal replication protein N